MLDALAAVEAAGIGDKDDFYTTLHAIFVKKHEHSLLFDQAFRIFWKRKGLLEKLIAMLRRGRPANPTLKPPEAGASRVADALFKSRASPRRTGPVLARARRPPDMSATEILRTKDFAQMSAAEIEEARKAIKRLVMPGRCAANATLHDRRPQGANRCAPQLPPLVAARRRHRPRVSLAARSRLRRLSRSATFPDR